LKSRDEFLGSVYAKRDAELARRKTYKKRLYSGLAACAACLVLLMGVNQAAMVDFLDAASSDGAAAEDTWEGGEAFNSGAVLEGIHDSADDMGAEAVPGSAAQGNAAPDIYDIAPDKTREEASTSAYYCLPCVTIEEQGEGDAAIMHASGIETVEKVKAWVNQLTEQGQVFVAEDAKLDGNADVTCIVTIEEEPQQMVVYYLIGEVGWYE